MNVEAYIASGILEAYVQGQLSPEERAEVESNLVRHPELRKELALLEDAQEALLKRMAVHPRAALKKSLMDRISSSSYPAPVAGLEAQGASWKWIAAAAIALALVATYFAFDFRSKWKESQQALSNIVAQNQQVAQDYSTVSDRLERLETDVNIMADPTFKRVVLKGTDRAPSAVASVYWNQATKEVYLSIKELQELSAEKQYQLWAIIDGKPVDAGVFDLTKGRLLRMRNISPGAKTFAITIEPKGGKLAPTLETMQVAGDVIDG